MDQLQELTDYVLHVDTFDAHNRYLAYEYKSGIFIRLIEISGMPRIMIEIGVETTTSDIKRAIPEALKWRDHLYQYQTPWLHDGSTVILSYLDRANRSGQSYGKLAERVNQLVSELLLRVAKKQLSFIPVWNLFSSNVGEVTFPSPIVNAVIGPSTIPIWQILHALRLKDDEIHEFVRYGLGRIREGELAFEKNYPISRDKLIAVLRWWRKKARYENIAQLAPDSPDILAFLYKAWRNSG